MLEDLAGDINGDHLGGATELPSNREQPALLLGILLLLCSRGDAIGKSLDKARACRPLARRSACSRRYAAMCHFDGVVTSLRNLM